jgi:hypothetical protein
MYTPVTDLIVKEIKWCEANLDKAGDASEDFRRGFIAGLEQARCLAGQFERAQASVPFHVEECD